jgi:thioesterase domain-containing protein
LSSTADAPDTVRVFNPEGRRPPIVFIGTYPSKDDENVARLATVLDADRPLFYLRPPAIADRAELDRVEHWLAHFRPIVAGLPLVPPYRFAGFSFGGILALELAREAQRRGDSIAYVGMIDSWRPELVARSWSEKIVELVTKLERAPTGGRRSVLMHFARRTARYRWTQLRGRRGDDVEPDARSRPPLQRAVMVSWLRYEPSPIDFPVALIACVASKTRFGGDPSLRWSPQFRGGWEQITIDGSHHELFREPYLDGTVAAFEASLARAEARLHAPARLAEPVAD